VSPDSIVPEPGSSGGFNRYRYTRNNPLRYRDPSGHCAEFGDDTCWSEYDKIKHSCPECETIVTGAGVVPLHEANYDRLRSYYENRITDPVTYPAFEEAKKNTLILMAESIWAYDREVNGRLRNIRPETTALVFGGDVQGSPPNAPQGGTAGIEAVFHPGLDEYSVLSSVGVTEGVGGGGSAGLYGGILFGVDNMDDLPGPGRSVSLNVAAGSEAATANLIWTPGDPKGPWGVTIGPAAGLMLDVSFTDSVSFELRNDSISNPTTQSWQR
jgi:hypothetical protein